MDQWLCLKFGIKTIAFLNENTICEEIILLWLHQIWTLLHYDSPKKFDACIKFQSAKKNSISNFLQPDLSQFKRLIVCYEKKPKMKTRSAIRSTSTLQRFSKNASMVSWLFWVFLQAQGNAHPLPLSAALQRAKMHESSVFFNNFLSNKTHPAFHHCKNT